MELNTERPSGSSPESLENKVILITGAAHRIGATMVRHLHEAGARIVLHYCRSHEAASKLQDELNALRVDSVALVAGDLDAVGQFKTVIDNANNIWGRLDGLINNASRFYPTLVNQASDEDWNNLMNTNLKAPFFLSQAAAPHLERQNGCIINIVDIHAERPLKEHAIYCMSKAGLAMMTKSLACELAPNIRVNGIAPGAILWPENDMDDETKQRIQDKTFLKRGGEPLDIARTALYLIRDANYTTGQILVIDGGRTQNS